MGTIFRALLVAGLLMACSAAALGQAPAAGRPEVEPVEVRLRKMEQALEALRSTQTTEPQANGSAAERLARLEGTIQQMGKSPRDAMYWFKELVIPLLTPIGLLLAYITYAVQKKLQMESQDRERYREATTQLVDYWKLCLNTDPREQLFDVGGIITELQTNPSDHHRRSIQNQYILRQIHLTNLEESYLYYEHPETAFQLLSRRVWVRAMFTYGQNPQFNAIYETNRGFYSSAFYRQMDLLNALRGVLHEENARQAPEQQRAPEEVSKEVLRLMATYLESFGLTPSRKPYPFLQNRKLRGVYNRLFPKYLLTDDGTWIAQCEDPVMHALLRKINVGPVDKGEMARAAGLLAVFLLLLPGVPIFILNGWLGVFVYAAALLIPAGLFLGWSMVSWRSVGRAANTAVARWLDPLDLGHGRERGEALVETLRQLDRDGSVWRFEGTQVCMLGD